MAHDRENKQHHHHETEAERIAREARERELERLTVLNELSHQNRGIEKGADDLAPHQERTPAEEHRGGPLPDQKR